MDRAARVDHYEVLGVSRDASAREIRLAYRRLARQHHPDVNLRPDGPERFAALASAYEVLSDPTARARYDQAHPSSVPITRAPRPHPRPPAPMLAGSRMTGTLELSAREADHLAHFPLTITDAWGRTIVQLPAGTGHGDRIAIRQRARLIVLRVVVRAGT
jgi:curved DNA-binding protein CbpA